MTDDRVVMMSSKGYKDLVQPENGKGLHWTCDINQELPIKMRQSGPGSEKPFTCCTLISNAVERGGDKPAMFVERGGVYQMTTWKDYGRQIKAFAKACTSLGCTSRAGVAIMGFNSPEWAIAYFGAICNDMVGTGIYGTNAPEACLY